MDFYQETVDNNASLGRKVYDKLEQLENVAKCYSWGFAGSMTSTICVSVLSINHTMRQSPLLLAAELGLGLAASFITHKKTMCATRERTELLKEYLRKDEYVQGEEPGILVSRGSLLEAKLS